MSDHDNPIRSLLEHSRRESRGLTFFLPHGTLAGIVEEITEDTVVAASQEFDRIAIRLDQIVGVAMQ